MAQAQNTSTDAVSGLQPLSYLNQNQPASVLFVRFARAPTTTDRRYKYGTLWLDTSSNQVYSLVQVASNSASWSLLGPGASDVDTLTGDTGGALSPTGGNINILGGDNLTVDGSGSTLTINLDSDAYPITPYVVGVSGDAGYATIQAALDAANAASGGIIAVQPGSYTEDLTLYADCYVVGLTNSLQNTPITITGTHTPPATGDTGFDRCNLVSATDIFSSAAAGTGLVYINNGSVAVTNGFIWNLPNWAGDINGNDIGDSGSTNNGVISNSGAATVFLNNGVFGAGSGQTMTSDATLTRLDLCEIACPMTISGGFLDINIAFFTGAVTLSGTSTGIIFNALFATGATTPITYSTSADFQMYQSIIDTSASPAIAGAGAGTLTFENITFMDDATLAATLTTARATTTCGTVKALTFDTDVAAAAVTLTATTLSADGTDANIGITVTPKGTGTLSLADGTGGNNVTMGNGINTVAQTVSIANGASAADSDVNILSGVGTAGAATLSMANNTRVTTVDLADIAPAAARTINIAGGDQAQNDTVNILNGAPSANSQTINVMSGNNAGGTQTVNIAQGTGGKTVNIGAGAGANLVTMGSSNTTSSLDLLAGTGNFSLDGAATTTYTFGPSTTSGTINFGGTGANTGTMTIAGGSGAQQVDVANSTGGKTLNIASGAGANTVTVGSTNTTSATTINSGSGGLTLTGDVSATTGDLAVTRSDAAAEVTSQVTNSDNTSTDSDSFFEAAVGGTSGGNPGIRFQISGGQAYSMGIDNASASDDLLICGDNDIGTDPLVTIAEAGDVTVEKGNLVLGAVATQLQMNGGAVTDFIGTATLVAGTVTVANTNIAATDRIFIQRQSVNSSTAIGNLTYSISAATSFTITSVQDAAPGSTETNDVSIVMYFIVRQN